jgi:HK97 family phage prohead protease
MKQIQLICEARLILPEAAGNAEPTGKIEATVTTWGPREGADGRRFYYKPEGFMKWAKDFAESKRPLPMFVNHNADAMPVGEWTAFEFNDKGMTAEGRLYLNTTQGSDLYQVMTESPAMFGGVSVGAYADEYQMVDAEGAPCDDMEEGYFQISQGGLREVSVVMHPNNPMAEVHKLEFFRPDGTADLKILEKALRDAGLSKKDAVAAASTFKKVLEQREVVTTVLEIAPTQGEPDAEATEAELLAALEQREILKHLSNRLKG